MEQNPRIFFPPSSRLPVWRDPLPRTIYFIALYSGASGVCTCIYVWVTFRLTTSIYIPVYIREGERKKRTGGRNKIPAIIPVWLIYTRASTNTQLSIAFSSPLSLSLFTWEGDDIVINGFVMSARLAPPPLICPLARCRISIASGWLAMVSTVAIDTQSASPSGRQKETHANELTDQTITHQLKSHLSNLASSPPMSADVYEEKLCHGRTRRYERASTHVGRHCSSQSWAEWITTSE